MDYKAKRQEIITNIIARVDKAIVDLNKFKCELIRENLKNEITYNDFKKVVYELTNNSNTIISFETFFGMIDDYYWAWESKDNEIED